MTHEELLWTLRRIPALIVHFSYEAKTREGGTFPEDLLASALNSRLWPLSSCLVWPSHQMNLPGSIGIILKPRSLSSIVSVAPTDSGSTSFDWKEGSLGEKLTTKTLGDSINVKQGDYNEWRVRDCEAVGVYVEEPIFAKKKEPLFTEDGEYLGEDIMAREIKPEDIYETFADLPVITRSPDRKRFVGRSIPVSVLYG